MSYELLEKAPKDHLSDEFLQFLKDNNVVVWESPLWLVIENCKYHTKEKPWLTAFYKPNFPQDVGDICDLTNFMLNGFDLLIKAPSRRTVKRFHVHLVTP